MNEGESQSLQISVTDIDSDLDNDLDFNWSLDGEWLRTAVGDSYTYQPSFEAAGDHTISIRVSERAHPELNLTAIWNIQVIEVNRPPQNVVLDEPKEGVVYKEGKVMIFRASTANDPDTGDLLTYTWKVDGETFSNAQTFETKEVKKGHHVIVLEVTDSKATVSKMVNITVEKKEEGPQQMDMTTIGMILLVLIIIVIVAIIALSGKKERPVKEEVLPDIYAADKKAMKAAIKKADKEEELVDEDEEREEEEEAED
jgi:hypothetical protein